MKRFAWLLLLLPSMAFAQTNIRWDLTAQTVTGHGQMVPVLALPGAFINFYTGCTHLPCTTAATTYISASSASTCPANAQVVWQLPLSQTCGAVADSQGNFGGYFQPGAYQYTITVSGHVNGPYQFNVGSSSGGAAGGCQGTIPGDNTSTNCGFNNRVPDTAALPASVSTFGANLLDTNSGTNATAVGVGNGSNNTANEQVLIGDTNGAYATQPGSILIGQQNQVGTVTNPCKDINSIQIGIKNLLNCNGIADSTTGDAIVGIGASNYLYNHTTLSGLALKGNVAIGEQNFYDNSAGGAANIDLAVGIGDFNMTGIVGHSAELIAIGDTNLSGATAGSTLFDVIGIGDTGTGNIATGSNDIVCIGDVNCADSLGGSVAQSFVVAMGFSNANIASGHDIIGIGDTSLGGDTRTSSFNSGNENIGIGDLAGVANTTGSDNIYIGDHAGAVSYTPSALGFANQTGSHNIYVGDNAGPGTASQLSNTIAIGFNAEPTASNTTWIGNSSVTSLILYGCSAGQIAYDDGTGTCITPLASPLTTKGDIFVYGSGNTRLPVGTNGQVLSANSAQTTGLQWISALVNPMTTLGDIIYGGVAGAATRLAGSTSASTLCLTQTGTGSASNAPVWAACSGSSATALSSITAASTNATINSVNNPIVWNWAQTTNSQSAFTFGENTAASGTGDVELTVSTAAGSTAIPLSITQSLNGAQTLPALSVTPTWNTSGVVDAAILVNATNTASGAASKLFDLQVGGTSKFAVDKAGIVTNGTWQGVAIANAFLANPATTVNGQTCTLGSTCTTTGNTTNSLTMNNGGAGAGSGTTFNGSGAVTLSYNTIGAAPTASPTFTGTITTPVTGSTQCLQVNSSGVIGGTGAACGSGGGGGFAGTVTYTTSHTVSAVGSQCAVGGNDNGCLIIMNCSSACALTLPNPQPTSTMLVGVISKGSSIATIALGSSMTYNGGLTAPILLSNSQISVASNSSVSTDYVGTTPFKAGSGTTITSTTANQTVAISGAQATVGSAEVVAFSATPTFSAAFNVSRIVLSGNITSFTMAGTGTDGTLKTLCFQQGVGSYTVAAPGNVHGFFTVGSVSTDWNCQSFAWDNTDSIWLATSAGVINQ